MSAGGWAVSRYLGVVVIFLPVGPGKGGSGVARVRAPVSSNRGPDGVISDGPGWKVMRQRRVGISVGVWHGGPVWV